MVVGESGLGKSTLVNSLFLGDLYKNRVVPSASDKIDKTTKIEKKTMDIEERGIRLRLSIVDTPGKLLNDVIFLAFCQVNISHVLTINTTSNNLNNLQVSVMR